MPTPHRMFRLLALLLAAPLANQAAAQRTAPAARPDAAPKRATPQGDDEWVRLAQDAAGDPTGLQTALARYRGTPEGASGAVSVDLIGAVHVGDRAYYEDLNRRFEQYDAVLFELVAPKGIVVPKGTQMRSDNPVGAAQNGMKTVLELEHQLELVDYTRPNFVHADMSPDEFFQTMKDRDEGLLKLYFRMLGQGIAEQSRASVKGESAEFDLLKSFFAKDRARQMKIAMAGQMTQLEGLLTNFGGEKGSTIIQERNRTAMDVLASQIAQGKRKIGVFYGAGHLADMDKRLRERFGLRQTDKEWLTAWDLRE